MPPTSRPPREPRPLPASLGQCVAGEALRTVRLWTEEQWHALAAEERPEPARHCPGLGWVSAGPVRRPRHRVA